MAAEKPVRRLPLRDLMIDAEKRAHDLAEHIQTTWMEKTADLRDLSRPVRRKSHYPTLQALRNALNKVQDATTEAERLVEMLGQELEEIRDHAKRERFNR